MRPQLGQTPAAPNQPPLISYKQKSTLSIAQRPGDRLTVEEMRLDLAVRVGPYRLHAGSSRTIALLQGQPQLVTVAKGANGIPTFVRIELTYNNTQPCYLHLSTQPGDALIRTRMTTGYVDLVLLSGEHLYAAAYDTGIILGTRAAEIMYTEVLI